MLLSISEIKQSYNENAAYPKLYCRVLEDGSGFGVFPKPFTILGPDDEGGDEWEPILSIGNTSAEAWENYKNDPWPSPA